MLAWCGAVAHAIEVRSDLSIGREFVYLANDVESEVLDGKLALGAGLTMVSDYAFERYGVQGLVEYRGEHVSAGVAAAFAPRQAKRGWAALDPHVELQAAFGRLQLDGSAGVLLRRIDAALRRGTTAVDQLQLHGDLELVWNERWRLAIAVLYSFYDPDPASPRLRGADLGLAVSLAGRPERWACGGVVGRRVVQGLRLAAGATGVVYADGRGGAAVPRVEVRLGPWRGIGITTSIELVIGTPRSSGESIGEVGGLALEYDR